MQYSLEFLRSHTNPYIILPSNLLFFYHLRTDCQWAYRTINWLVMLTTRKGASASSVLPFRHDDTNTHDDDNSNDHGGTTATNTNHYRYQRKATSRHSASKWTSITSGTVSPLSSHLYIPFSHPLIYPHSCGIVGRCDAGILHSVGRQQAKECLRYCS